MSGDGGLWVRGRVSKKGVSNGRGEEVGVGCEMAMLHTFEKFI